MSGDAADRCYQPRRAATFEMLSLRGLPARIARWGSGTDPVLLLHGFLDTCETYQFLVDEMPADWNFIALDWRGFGDSAQNGAPYWFPDYLADLDALLELLAPDGALRLVGHSMGGNVAALYAGARPERVRALVSLEGFGLAPTQPEQAPARFARWLEELRTPPERNRYESLAQFAKLLLKRNSRLSPERAQFIARAWTRPHAGGGVELRGDPWHRLVNPQLYRREEAEACWRAYDGPVQMLLANKSDHLRHLGESASPAAFERVFRQLELRTLAGVGHMMHHEDPAQVAAAIQPFLARHAAN
jgi:pimeloyl-ACP methyl ester carboxylesterase